MPIVIEKTGGVIFLKNIEAGERMFIKPQRTETALNVDNYKLK